MTESDGMRTPKQWHADGADFSADENRIRNTRMKPDRSHGFDRVFYLYWF
jgi:hypothetical protein